MHNGGKRTGKCPICLNNDTRLVEHHWYDDDSHCVGHIRLICQSCNQKLGTCWINNHVLPNFESQKLIAIKGDLLYPRAKRDKSDKTVVISVRIPISLNHRIIILATKNGITRNTWIQKALKQKAAPKSSISNEKKGENDNNE